jgi:hypothetical protein
VNPQWGRRIGLEQNLGMLQVISECSQLNALTTKTSMSKEYQTCGRGGVAGNSRGSADHLFRWNTQSECLRYLIHLYTNLTSSIHTSDMYVNTSHSASYLLPSPLLPSAAHIPTPRLTSFHRSETLPTFSSAPDPASKHPPSPARSAFPFPSYSC